MKEDDQQNIMLRSAIRRQTLHITDDQHRFALIDTLTVDNGITLSSPVETTRYQYDNHLGSASLELDQNAAFISYEEYHPFGTTSYRSGRTETEVALKRYKYVGKERDEETGLYYYGARYGVYPAFRGTAWLCRFVSVDPLQFKYPHYTPYQYAGNKPVSYIDLDGLEEEKKEEPKTNFFIKEGDVQAKEDIEQLAGNSKYIDISATGAVSMSDKFQKLSSEKRKKALKDEGLQLIYDLTKATYEEKDENGTVTVKDAKILYQTEGGFQFSGFKEDYLQSYIPLNDWEGKSGQKSVYIGYGEMIKPVFFWNASITTYGNEASVLKQTSVTLLPKDGYQGQVALARGEAIKVEYGGTKLEDVYDKNGRIIGQQPVQKILRYNVRLDILKHELRENLFRLSGMNYNQAHAETNKMYNDRGGVYDRDFYFKWN